MNGVQAYPEVSAPVRTPPTELGQKLVPTGGTPSWYLDPLVAAQKRRLNAALLQKVCEQQARLALKTDSFEEAFGQDSPLEDILPLSRTWLVMDHNAGTVGRAQVRVGDSVEFLAGDATDLPFQTASLDLVFSNSTLDHAESSGEFDAAVREIGRVLGPHGRLILTMDNPLNLLYWPLRWFSRTRVAPFSLGYTPSPWRMKKVLEDAGFEVTGTGVLIHNPRGVSTLLFLLLRRLLGSNADRPIQALLDAFESLDRLPTRHFTGCFQTLSAVRRDHLRAETC